MRWLLVLVLACYGGLTRAETVVAAQNIRAGTILTETDLLQKRGDVPGALSDPAAAIGMEARVVLYAGRPVRVQDIGPPAMVRRNQLVPLVFVQAGLRISTGGRALDRGAVGELVRVMNLASKKTLFGRVMPDGSVDVSGS